MTPVTLSFEERSLLRTVRIADEEDGGFDADDADAHLREMLWRLVEARLIECTTGVFRITGLGVDALASGADESG